jgi:hypothetical protein
MMTISIVNLMTRTISQNECPEKQVNDEKKAAAVNFLTKKPSEKIIDQELSNKRRNIVSFFGEQSN